ncbi:MAG: hypothetical protein ACI89L_000597 [Phycisphaerales bacterium]|jgi:hypothetical protein
MKHASAEVSEPGSEELFIPMGSGLEWWARVDMTLAAIWLVAAIYNNSDAGPGVLLTLGLGASGLYLAGAWVVRSIVGLFSLRSRPRRWKLSATVIGHVLIPLAGMLGFVTAFTQLDTRARFALSQSAFEQEAAAVRAGQPATGSRWVGLYRVRSAYLLSDGSVRFTTRHASLFTEYGFAQPGDGPLQALGGPIESQPLVGPWKIYQQYD